MDLLLPPWRCPSHGAAVSLESNVMLCRKRSACRGGSGNVGATPFLIATLDRIWRWSCFRYPDSPWFPFTLFCACVLQLCPSSLSRCLRDIRLAEQALQARGGRRKCVKNSCQHRGREAPLLEGRSQPVNHVLFAK